MTEESTVDHNLFQADSTSASHMVAQSETAGADVHDRLQTGHQHDQQQRLETSLMSSFDERSIQQQGQPDTDVAHSRQGAVTGLGRRRAQLSKWQRMRQVMGSRQAGSSAAGTSARGEIQLQKDTASQREVLHNVKAVVPHLSDEVILAELECTLDANQAVENLLSQM